MKKRVWSYLMLMISFVMLVACTAPQKEMTKETTAQPMADTHYPVTITTYNFAKEPVEVTFNKAPEKVVAIYQSPIETMLALGLADKVQLAVGLDDPVKQEWQADFEKIKYLEKKPTKEEVLAMEPDLILSWSSLFSEKNYGDVGFWHERDTNTYIWQNSGIKSPNTLDNEYQDILNIGKIFNVQDKAQKLVDDMNADLEKAAKSVADKEKVRVLILEVEDDGQYRVYGLKTIGGDIAKRAGADVLGGDAKTIGKEELIALNPDVIFSVYFNGFVTPEEAVSKIQSDDSLKTVKALEQKKVLPIVLSEVYASGVRTHDGIKTIIKGIYGE